MRQLTACWHAPNRADYLELINLEKQPAFLLFKGFFNVADT